MMTRLVLGASLGVLTLSASVEKGLELGLLSDFAIDVEDLEFLEAILVDACNELKISPDHQGVVARVVDLRSQGHSREEIFRILKVEFATHADGRQS